jgi:hypothetical protein
MHGPILRKKRHLSLGRLHATKDQSTVVTRPRLFLSIDSTTDSRLSTSIYPLKYREAPFHYPLPLVGKMATENRRRQRYNLAPTATVIVYSLISLAVVSAQDFTCDTVNDECSTKTNGECDSSLGSNPQPGCLNGDCFDCDLCGQFDLDCNGCLNAQGCFWCPGDAKCYNSQNYQWKSAASSCNAPLDYIESGTCSQTGNFFRFVRSSCFFSRKSEQRMPTISKTCSVFLFVLVIRFTRHKSGCTI